MVGERAGPTGIEDSGAPYRTAIGFEALLNNIGYYNTASGHQALYSNTTGSSNTGSGFQALYSNTTGTSNTASGSLALFSNTIGFDNTASGYQALAINTTGRENTASGSYALVFNTTGRGNTASGFGALYSNTTGQSNTAIGDQALRSNTTGELNAALGSTAGFNAPTGSYNVFLGAEVRGTAADTNTIRIGLPYNGSAGQNKTFIAGIYGTQLTGPAVQVFIDANGQLGTLTAGVQSGTIDVPISQLEQQVRDQQAAINDLRARLARLEALVVASAGRK